MEQAQRYIDVMRELTRSNDPVLISYLQTELAREGIECLLLDGYGSSVLEPINLTAQQRLMVGEPDYWASWAVLADAEGLVSEDELLGGRFSVFQPKDGFRTAIDPIFLAASVPAESGDYVLDIGTGTGAAAQALVARQPWAWAVGLDIQMPLIALADRAATRSITAERLSFYCGDIANPPPQIATKKFDHVMSNPPYMVADTGQVPKDEAKRMANFESTIDLAGWITSSLSLLRPGGSWTMVHRTERVEEILSVLESNHATVRILDLLPMNDGRPSKRSIVSARLGSFDKTERMALVLHQENGEYTPEADAILRDAQPSPIVMAQQV